MSEIERYRPTMSGDILQSWAVDAQAAIDRLKAKLVKWRELHDSEITRSENLQRLLAEVKQTNIEHAQIEQVLSDQLAETRAEVERFKHMAEQNSTEMCEWMEKYNKARQEAAREIVELLKATAITADVQCVSCVADLIKAKFKLEG